MWTRGRASVPLGLPEAGVPTVGSRQQFLSGLAPLKVEARRFFLAMCRGRLLKAPWIEDAIEASALWCGHSRHFRLRRSDLYLSGTSYRFVDFERSAFPGRVGHTLALLRAEQLGHRWFAHFAEVLPESFRASERTPDFVAASAASVVALESKATTARGRGSKTFLRKVAAEHNTQGAPWLDRGLYLNGAVTTGTRVTATERAEQWVLSESASSPPASVSPVVHNYRPWFTLAGASGLWRWRQRSGAATPPPHLNAWVLVVEWRGGKFSLIVHDEGDVDRMRQGFMPQAVPFTGPRGPMLIAFPTKVMEVLLRPYDQRGADDERVHQITEIVEHQSERVARFEESIEFSDLGRGRPSAILHGDGILVLQELEGVEVVEAMSMGTFIVP